MGAVGNDIYKDKIINSLKEAKVEPMLEILQEKTSRCGVGIYKRDRCLVPDIQASKNISKEFIEEKLENCWLVLESQVDIAYLDIVKGFSCNVFEFGLLSI